MNVAIREAVTAADRDAVYRFRYAVYVDEMNKHQAHADHSNRTVCEPLDDTGTIIAAFEGNDVIGTVRTNWTHLAVGHYWGFYSLDAIGDYALGRATITSKMMVAAEHRRSLLGLRLASAIYRYGYTHGTRFDFINCNPSHGLKPFFEKLGFRQVFPNAIHPEYGEAVPMILALADRSHLAAVGSPFVRALDEMPSDDASVEFFYDYLLPRSHSTAPASGAVMDVSRPIPSLPLPLGSLQ